MEGQSRWRIAKRSKASDNCGNSSSSSSSSRNSSSCGSGVNRCLFPVRGTRRNSLATLLLYASLFCLLVLAARWESSDTLGFFVHVAEANIRVSLSKDTRRMTLLGLYSFGPNGYASFKIDTLTLDPVPRAATTTSVSTSTSVRSREPLKRTDIGFLCLPVNSTEEARATARFFRGETGGSVSARHSFGTADLMEVGYVSEKDDDDGEENQDEAAEDERSVTTRYVGRYCPASSLWDRPNVRMFPISGHHTAAVVNQAKTVEMPIRGGLLYAIYFYNCVGYNMNVDGGLTNMKSLPRSKVTLKGSIETFWMESAESAVGAIQHAEPRFLSYYDTALLPTYLACDAAYLILCLVWVLVLLYRRHSVRWVHVVMLMLVVVKAAAVALEYFKAAKYQRTGGYGTLLNSVYYATTALNGLLLFTVIVLLGTGWSTLHAFLSASDARSLLVILPTQALLQICVAASELTGEGSKHRATWMTMLRIADAFCCVCVLLPIYWSVQDLKHKQRGFSDVRTNDDADHGVTRGMEHIRAFRALYISVVAYMYASRVLLPMISRKLSYTHTWVPTLLQEVVVMVLFTYNGYIFHPPVRKPAA